MAINTAAVGRALSAGFIEGTSKKWQPDMTKLLTRTIKVPRQDEVRVYGLGDLGLPERNAQKVNFERAGAWSVDVKDPDSWDKGFAINEREMIQVPRLVQKARSLPALFARGIDDHLLTMIVEGDTTTYGTPWTSKKFFALIGAGHKYVGDVAYKTAMANNLTKTEAAGLDVTTASAPTVAEWKTALDDVQQYVFSKTKDTAGNNLFTGNEPITLIVPPNMFYTAKEAFQATTQAAGGENVYYGAIKALIKDSRLTDTDVWYMLVEPSGTLERPFWFAQWPIGSAGKYVDFAMTDQKSATYVDNSPGEFHFRASMRSKLVYGDWRLMYRCTFE